MASVLSLLETSQNPGVKSAIKLAVKEEVYPNRELGKDDEDRIYKEKDVDLKILLRAWFELGNIRLNPKESKQAYEELWGYTKEHLNKEALEWLERAKQDMEEVVHAFLGVLFQFYCVDTYNCVCSLRKARSEVLQAFLCHVGQTVM